MKKQIIILALFITFQSFGQDLEIRQKVMRIATAISQNNQIDPEYVGSHQLTEQYKLFIKLTKKALTPELIELMKHDSPAVRGYSFWALAKRHYADLAILYQKHMDDPELVNQISGCIGFEAPLSLFLESVITPNSHDSECKKLKITESNTR